jgi:type I restriction enzyme S subunit
VSKWVTVTLDSVTTDGSDGLRRGPFGGAIKKDSFVPDGYKIYEQRHAIYGDFEAGSYYIGDRRYKELRTFAVMPGDLIVSCSGTLGRVAIVPPSAKPGIINQALLRIRPKPDVVSSQFFKMLLETPGIQSRLFGSAGGSAIKNVKPLSEIRRVEFQLPPLPEQQRIAEVLDRAGALRAKRHAALAQLDTLTQSIFLDLFGHPHHNPKRFSREPLGQVCERVTVGYVGPMAEEYVERGIPLLRSLNVRRGRIDLHDLKFVSPQFHTKLSKSAIRAGDVVTVRTGQPGTTAVVPKSLGDANCADLIVMTCGPRLDPQYLSEALNIWLGDAESIQGQVGAIQIHFNIGRAKELRLPIPPLALQHEFTRRIEAARELKTAQKASLTDLDALFAALQHQAFRGEL